MPGRGGGVVDTEKYIYSPLVYNLITVRNLVCCLSYRVAVRMEVSESLRVLERAKPPLG